MNTVRGSLPIVEYLKYSITNCLKGENKERIWNAQEAERPERVERGGGMRAGG